MFTFSFCFSYFFSLSDQKEMNSIDNPRQPLTSSSRTFVKYSEMRPDDPSNSRNSTGRLSVNQYELRRLPTRQRRVVKKSLMANVGYRLAKRKQLHIDRFAQ